jgi:hypothetical protein
MKKIKIGAKVKSGKWTGTYKGVENTPFGKMHIVITDNGQKLLTGHIEVAK